jgi:Domain of unknown function (DUF4157)
MRPVSAARPEKKKSAPLRHEEQTRGARRESGAGDAAPLSQRIRAASHGGQRLPLYLQQAFQRRMDVNASHVRIHTGAEADGLSRAVEARAFTTGQDIFFRGGEYRPYDPGGLELLAHEVIHTEQQRKGSAPAWGRPSSLPPGFGPASAAEAGVSRSAQGPPIRPIAVSGITVSQPGDRFEQEADLLAHTFVRGGTGTPSALAGAGPSQSVQRKCAACASGGAPCPQCEEDEKLHIQRQPIDFRPLTWKDFQAKVPKDADHDAWTETDFADPALASAIPAKLIATDTGKSCKAGGTSSTIHKVDIAIDSSNINVKAQMTPSASWRQDWVMDKTARKAKCLSERAPKCEKKFDDEFAKIPEQRKKEVAKCQKSFDDAGKDAAAKCKKVEAECKGWFKKGGTFGRAATVAECSTMVVEDCKNNILSGKSFGNSKSTASKRSECEKPYGEEFEKAARAAISATDSQGGESFTVAKREDCRKPAYLDACANKLMQAGADKLLVHERNHFNLVNAMAEKAQRDLRALAASFPKEVTGCGEGAAKEKAKKTLEDELKKLSKKLDAEEDEKSNLQKKYDDETKHGTVEGKQTEWEKTIAKGFLKTKP